MSLRFILIFCGLAHSFALLSKDLKSIVNARLLPSDLAKMKAVDPNWNGEGIFNKITPVAGLFAHKETNEIILETKEKLWTETEILEGFVYPENDILEVLDPADDYKFLKTNNWNGLFFRYMKNMKTDKLHMYWNEALAEIVDVNTKYTMYEETVLMRAVRFNRNNVVNMLLERDAYVNAKDQSGRTALHYAVDYNNVNAIELLLKCGAKIDAIDNFGRTPLMTAVKFSAINPLKALLKRGARVDMKECDGSTALHYATHHMLYDYQLYSLYNGSKMIELLLKSKADIDATDKRGETPLMRAVRDATTDAVKLLLERGARLDLKNEDNNTAQDIAAIMRDQGDKEEHIYKLLEAQQKKALLEQKKIKNEKSNSKNWFMKLCGKPNRKKEEKLQSLRK